MDNKKDNSVKIKRLATDIDYYNNVFKKTEKLVSVTFYILSHINKKEDNLDHIQRIKDKALQSHEAALQTLTLQAHETEEGMFHFQYTLVAFESTMRMAEAAGAVPADIATLVYDQIDVIQRYINNHFNTDGGFDLLESETATRNTVAKNPEQRRQRRVKVPAGDISTDAYLVYSQLTDRAERIKTVLEAKPKATIKDISEVVTDVSEKTIQRELNSLIEKGQVIREGERRWSTYSVLK